MLCGDRPSWLWAGAPRFRRPDRVVGPLPGPMRRCRYFGLGALGGPGRGAMYRGAKYGIGAWDIRSGPPVSDYPFM